jgi:hypothetical protein
MCSSVAPWVGRFFSILLLLCGPAFAAPGTPTPASPAAKSPKSSRTPAAEGLMLFYVVKGAADACGRGCDRWIAAEGKIDAAAAGRFRKFLGQLGDAHLPIYFNSPGGNLDQAIAIGAILRERPVMVRVGRAVITECGFEAQDGTACAKLKQSGRELHGDLWTRNAVCASACPYLIMGTATREIPPDAVLGVHSPRVLLHFSGGVPTEEMRTAAVASGLERADRLIADYLHKVGADPGLLVLARTVKFTDVHVLTREEIARFGIDRREIAETSWEFENDARSMVGKAALQLDGNDKSFRTVRWRLLCFNASQFELDFQRKAVSDGLYPAISISNGDLKPLFFTTHRYASGYEIWAMRINRTALGSLSGQPQFDLIETLQMPDGKRLSHVTKFSSEGLAGGLDRLVATCPPTEFGSVPMASGGAKAK